MWSPNKPRLNLVPILLNIDLLFHVVLDFGRELLTPLKFRQLSILSRVLHHHLPPLGRLPVLLFVLHIVQLLHPLVLHLVPLLLLTEPLLLHHRVELSFLGELLPDHALFLLTAEELGTSVVRDFLKRHLGVGMDTYLEPFLLSFEGALLFLKLLVLKAARISGERGCLRQVTHFC